MDATTPEKIETSLAIVIANWNRKDLLARCLESLACQTAPAGKIIVVDNGSTDGSVAWIRGNFPEVEVIALEENRGFAAANNLGIRRAFQEPAVRYLLTLNNDTRATPEFLERLLACADRHPEAGAVQPKVVNFYDPARLDSTGMVISTGMEAANRGLQEPDEGRYDREEEIFGAAASAALYARQALERVALRGEGGEPEYFDERYFAYHEDVDLAWRLRLAGFRAFYTPAAKVFHVHSATVGGASPFKAFYVHRNHFFNMIKCLPLRFLARALLLMPATYGRAILEMFRGRGAAAELTRQSSGGSAGTLGIVVRGWLEVLRHLPEMCSKRRQVQALRRVDSCEIESWFARFGPGVRSE